MSDSPISIEVSLNGISPNERFHAALEELGAAASELSETSGDTEGFSGLELPYLVKFHVTQDKPRDVVSYVYMPEFKK